jgi:two-component system cell cycle response regulator
MTSTNNKPAILLVDDNTEILEFLTDDLSEYYKVFTALNGQEALLLLSTEAIQLVISDIMMPVMDGYELCRSIKSNIEHSHIPVILLTAKNTLQSKIQGLEEGADAYIEKPFSPAYLQVQIANLLSNRIKIREHFANTPLVNINTVAHTRADEIFLQNLHELIMQNISNVALDVDLLASKMNLSRASLYRKISAVTNLTPLELINITRLKRAAELLAGGEHRIYEICDMTGFNSQSNFGRSFLKQFGLTPSAYAMMKKEPAREE